jgi:DNA helicase-2/ATP-dependent DNA helicase PcrA
VLAHLRIAANPQDERAWFRLAPQLPRVGQATTRRIWDAIAADPLARMRSSETRALLPSAARESWEHFCDVLQAVVDAPGPGLAIEAVLAGPHHDHLAATYDNPAGRREDLRGLADFAGQYQALDRFLAELALSGESAGETVLGGRDDEQEALTCSTVHQAKGLEWPVVLVPWLADGRFPHESALDDQDALEEERRVFHVAVTRAESDLLLLSPRVSYARHGAMLFMKPSQFLRELPAELVERLDLEEEPAP